MSPKGTLAMHLRDALGPIYQDEDFADLYAKKWGRPAHAPWRLALVTVLQAIEGLSDKQAAEAAQVRIDWRYALSLSIDDPVFDHTVLTDFRQRLLEHSAEDRLLEPILRICREQGWVSSGGKQRTDSTIILARTRTLSSLESVGESMRATLNALADTKPDWLLEHINPDWFDRYVHRFELARFPKEESKRKQLRADVGSDVHTLLQILDTEQAPKAIAELTEVSLLRQVWQQHYEVKDGQACWRDGPAVQNSDRVLSPYDPDARSSRKRDTTWQGYKVHLTETCDQDPERPHLIINVETTPATIQDNEVLDAITESVAGLDLVPSQHLMDQAYPSGHQLVQQAEKGTEIVAPVRADGGWQHREEGGYAAADFELDWQNRVATCPQGQTTTNWSSRTDEHGQPMVLIRFPRALCQDCPVRDLCTQATATGRALKLHVQPVQQALQERREEQRTPAFQARYALRAGIEGTVAQGMHLGLRQSPYMGTAKTHLHHLAIAAGINLIRIDAHFQAQTNNKPTRPTRQRTPFARLQELWAEKAA